MIPQTVHVYCKKVSNGNVTVYELPYSVSEPVAPQLYATCNKCNKYVCHPLLKEYINDILTFAEKHGHEESDMNSFNPFGPYDLPEIKSFILPKQPEHSMPDYTSLQLDIHNQVMMLCGASYYGEPSHKQVMEVSQYSGTKRHVGIAMIALDILVKANAEPARQAYLKGEIQKGHQYPINVFEKFYGTASPQDIQPVHQGQIGYTQIASQGNNSGMLPLHSKYTKINRYLVAYVSEASRGNVVAHQSVSEFQVRLICTVCNATLTYDEDAQSDWVMQQLKDFCHGHQHTIQVDVDVPVIGSNRRKFRDE